MHVSPFLSTFGLQISIMNFILGRTIVRISRDHGHLSNLLKSLPLDFCWVLPTVFAKSLGWHWGFGRAEDRLWGCWSWVCWGTRVPTTGRSKLREAGLGQRYRILLALHSFNRPGGAHLCLPRHCLTQENILFYYYYFWPHHRVCGSLVSLPGLNPDPWQWKRQVLTTGVLYLVVQLCLTLWNPMDCSPSGTSVRGDSPGLNTGVNSLSLLQGLFPTQVWNLGLPHCRQILYHLSHQQSPRILEGVAYPFSRGPSQPRNRTGVSCTAGGFFTSWLTTGLPGNSQETRFSYKDRNRFESERTEKDSPRK